MKNEICIISTGRGKTAPRGTENYIIMIHWRHLKFGDTPLNPEHLCANFAQNHPSRGLYFVRLTFVARQPQLVRSPKFEILLLTVGRNAEKYARARSDDATLFIYLQTEHKNAEKEFEQSL